MQRFCGPHPPPLQPHQPFHLPCRRKLSITPSPDPTLASPAGELIIFNMQIAELCFDLSAVGLEIGSGRAGPNLFRAGLDIFGPCRVLLPAHRRLPGSQCSHWPNASVSSDCSQNLALDLKYWIPVHRWKKMRHCF